MNSSKRIICKICFRKNTPLELIEQHFSEIERDLMQEIDEAFGEGQL